MKHIVNFSGGKDSTAMLLHMIDLDYPIDEVINMDTGMEFPAMYEHIAKVRKIVEAKGIKFTVLKADKTFEYLLHEYEYYSKKHDQYNKGYGWARSRSRWCTSKLKIDVYNRYIKKYENEDITTYVGIAFDEQYRLERENNKKNNHVHPLVDWKWAEADALQYCYDRGFDFGGLYKVFKRVSCWLCPLQSLAELKKLYFNFPYLWEKLKTMETKTDMTFRMGVSLPMLEARFNLEAERESKGLTISPNAQEFRTALKEVYSEFPSLKEQGFCRLN